jgi:hypothetical protein
MWQSNDAHGTALPLAMTMTMMNGDRKTYICAQYALITTTAAATAAYIN